MTSLTKREAALIEIYKKIPDVGNMPPMFHVTENQVDLPALRSLEVKGIMKRTKLEWKKGFLSCYMPINRWLNWDKVKQGGGDG